MILGPGSVCSGETEVEVARQRRSHGDVGPFVAAQVVVTAPESEEIVLAARVGRVVAVHVDLDLHDDLVELLVGGDGDVDAVDRLGFAGGEEEPRAGGEDPRAVVRRQGHLRAVAGEGEDVGDRFGGMEVGVRARPDVGRVELVGDRDREADVGAGGVVDPGAVVVAAAVDDFHDQLRVVGGEEPEESAARDADAGEWHRVGVTRRAAVQGRLPVELDLPTAVAGRLIDAQRGGVGGAEGDGGRGGRWRCESGQGEEPGESESAGLRCVEHGFS